MWGAQYGLNPRSSKRGEVGPGRFQTSGGGGKRRRLMQVMWRRRRTEAMCEAQAGRGGGTGWRQKWRRMQAAV